VSGETRWLMVGRAVQAILFSVISYFMLQFDMEAGGARAL